MSRGVERGIPWPEGRRFTLAGWQRPPRLEVFLKIQGVNLDSKIPPSDWNLLKTYYRLRQLVKIEIISPITAATRFERRLERKGVKEDFFERYGDILQKIAEGTKPPK